MKIPTARFSACVRYAFSILVALSVFSFQSHAQQATANLDRIASFMQAYNAHDINAMLLNMTEDVKWLNVANNQLNEAMQAHFKAKPDARSRIKDSIVLGNTIAIVEEAFSLKNGITSSQCAMSIYQLRKGLISSITYYATAKC